MDAKQEKNLSTERPSLITKIANKYGVDPDKMMLTLKSTAFKQKEEVKISNEQMMALLIVADQYGLNPFTREIYAFPDSNRGIIPVVGVDGWSRIINNHKHYNGMKFLPSSETVTMQGAKECPIAMTCIIYHKERSFPTEITEFLDECYRSIASPWKTHTKRMLRHKAMIQCARIAFSFAGIYDEDESQRIFDGVTFDVATEPDSHQSERTKNLNENILNGSNTKKSKPKQPDPSFEDDVFGVEGINKIDLIADIKRAKEGELFGLDALIFDLEEEDQEDCKKEILQRRNELGVKVHENGKPAMTVPY